MPDWFYRTVSRPLLYRLRPHAARSFALGFMGGLARLPLGPFVIDLLGHMRADPRLAVSHFGKTFPTAIGLGPGLDPQALALPALARFGVGFLDISVVSRDTSHAVERDDEREAIVFPDDSPALGLTGALPKLKEAHRLGLPLIVRTDGSPEVVEAVRPFVSAIAVPVSASPIANDVPVLVIVRPNDTNNSLLEAALKAGAAGVLVDGAIPREKGGTEIGEPVRELAVARVRAIRERFGDIPIVVGGGVHEPEHAIALLDAGANLIEVDSGLVFTGPGLVKATNDAVLCRELANGRCKPAGVGDSTGRLTPPARQMTWFWTTLMGVGMFIGALLALGIAATRVVLPYDEAFLGMSREQLHTINPRLLAFMAHDRVSLAGPMLLIGILYIGLSLGGIRRGVHWAMVAVFASAGFGFCSFFLFLGFGYLDTLHAFVTACLLQLLLLGVHSELGTYHPTAPHLRTDRAWRRAQWGQLLLVGHGVAVLVAGLIISTVGITAVFVHEDLEFMQTTREHLVNANPRLVPLVAHDRATFGGMLVSSGIVLLLTALWGFRAGNAWVWWSLLLAGVAGYVPAIVVHIVVGYTDGMHLLPAFVGLGVFLLGLALSHAFLCKGNAGPESSGNATTERTK